MFVGRPDIAVGRSSAVDVTSEPDEAEESAAVGVLDVEVSINDKLEERFLDDPRRRDRNVGHGP